MDAVLSEFIKAMSEILRQVGEHPNEAIAFAGLLVALISYMFFRDSKAIRPLTLVGFVAALIAITALFLFHPIDPAVSAPNPSNVYYAGPGDDPLSFNVGYFEKTTDNLWTDSVLKSVKSGPDRSLVQTPITARHNYKIDKIVGNTLRLKGTDPNREDVIIELNLERQTISYVANETEIRQLYEIIASR
jgi:hypothetical protein